MCYVLNCIIRADKRGLFPAWIKPAVCSSEITSSARRNKLLLGYRTTTIACLQGQFIVGLHPHVGWADAIFVHSGAKASTT